MKNLKPLYGLICLLVLGSGHAAAWPTAVNFASDLGSGDGHAISKKGASNILRCDSANTFWEGSDSGKVTPDSCHRHGLIWSAVWETPKLIVRDKDKQTIYNPSVAGEDWRLPTIKELVRLFNYTGTVANDNSVTNNGIPDLVLSTWLAGVTDGYLISSTYRNLVGAVGSTNKENHIFATHIASGRVVAVYPGSTGDIRLCLGLRDSDGDCQDFSNEAGPRDTKAAAIDYAKKDFFALKVRMQTVAELGYE